jgi:hypothetical protein
MTKKDLVKIIREVVKREVKSVVKNEINEVLTLMEQGSNVSNKPKKEQKKYTSNTSLNSILNETANGGEFDEWPEVSANSLRARFAGMQGGAAPMTDINNRPVDTSKLDPALNKALTRDYSELVKRFK